jgi:chromosome partitioning protein
MRVIAVHTSKGGVGKTTLVVNIAYELARQNNKVLVIDLDDQANASLSLGVNKADELDHATDLAHFQKILNSFKERKELIDFLKDCDLPNLDYKKYVMPSPSNYILSKLSNCQGSIDVIPGSYRTQDYVIKDAVGSQNLLDIAIERSSLCENYDYVIIDTPPSSTDITKNGLLAANYVLIPTQLEYLSAFGVAARLEMIRTINLRSKGSRSIVLGVVPMMVSKKKTKLNEIIRNVLERQIEDIPILSEIHDSSHIRKASHDRKPLLAEKSKLAKAAADEFSHLTQELLDRIKLIESEVNKENG